jgi:probable DNA repair protein
LDASLYEFLASGAPLLTSSRRLAHALRADYAASAQARGQIVWQTPQILPWSTYVRDACLAPKTKGNSAAQLLSDAQSLALWEAIIGASDVGSDLLNPALAARAAMRTWQRIHQYQVSLVQLQEYPSEEAQTFAAWALAFAQRTQARGWLDSARLTALLLNTPHPPAPRIALVGFDQLAPEDGALIAHWRASGCQVDLVESSVNVSTVRVVAAQDTDSELETAARWARAQLENGKERIAVIVPNLVARVASAKRVFADIFSPGQRRSGAHAVSQAFSVAASTSLVRYPLVHSALLALRLAQGRADSTVAGQMLRSPFFAGAETEMSERALADVRLREERLDRWDLAALERWAGANHCATLAQNTRTALSELLTRDATLPSIWSERFSLVLRNLGWCRNGLPGRALDSDEQQTQRKFYEVLTAFGALDEVLGRINFAAALSRLRDLLTQERFSPETPDCPVLIIDPDTVAGMRFDAAWVLGLHATEWPAPPDPDPFIPIELQRTHGIPEASADTCLALAKQKLQRLAACAPEVVLSWPERDAGAELRASPLLTAWPLVGADTLPRSNVISLRDQQFMQRAQLESVQDIQLPILEEGQARGGARILELQSRCPFRAQAELRLGATAMQTVMPGIAADERGTLVHRVLADLWANLDGSIALQALSNEQLEERVRAIAERQAAKVLPATTTHAARLATLEVRSVVQWVMALLAVERQRPAFRVHRAEQSEHFVIGGLAVRIQPDRMDELSNGQLLLIDYKTGTAYTPSQWLDTVHPGRPASPQLPLYALAHAQNLAALAFVIVAPGVAEYRGFGDAQATFQGVYAYAESKRQLLHGVETWDALLHHWHEVLAALAYSYQAGEAEVDPLYGECRNCELSMLCRISERTGAASSEEGSDE